MQIMVPKRLLHKFPFRFTLWCILFGGAQDLSNIEGIISEDDTAVNTYNHSSCRILF